VLALWVLSGWRITLPAFLMAFLLLFIVVTNVSEMEVVFRDVSLAGLAIALGLAHLPKKQPV
jgi:hypothetical protein